ncbi:MAG TPA: glycosyltransferase [Thermoanaerobaculia bacterium]
MTVISLLIVNYRSAALAADAIRTARATTRMPLQAVVVDNTLDPAEAEALRAHADIVIAAPSNRGYSGGINLGRPHCQGDVLVVSNPDVVFADGCLDRLAEALDKRTAVAGPAFFWDDAHEWRLPPADLSSGWDKLDEVLASRAASWRAERDRRRFRKRVQFWSLRETTHVDALSGAVMAIRAADFDAVDGFDERFPLYYEEIDFVRRLAERRRKVAYVPDARCRHIFDQSAGQAAEEAAQRYAQSELRYLEKWNGPFAARTLKKLEKPVQVAATFTEGRGLAVPRPDETVVEVSPLPSFATAAGHFPKGEWVELPEEITKSFRRGALYLRTVQRLTGEVFATVKISPDGFDQRHGADPAQR